MPTAPATLYRGSPKHKNRPARGAKGTLCPEWTHVTPAARLGMDVEGHAWGNTAAATLFAEAISDPETERRFATRQGIAFEAKPTADGTWHGFPIPWESVPAHIKANWQATGAVTRRELKTFWMFDRDDIHWALQTDLR